MADETLQRLLSNGIMRHSFEIHEYFIKLKAYKILVISTHDHFSMSDLAYGFNLWIASLILSFIVFMVELSWFYLHPFHRMRNKK